MKHILFISTLVLLHQHVVVANIYTVTDLGTLGSPGARPLGINSHGQIVGFSGLQGFIWDVGVMTDIGSLPGDDEVQAHGINDRGQVVGRSISSADPFHSRAFLWESGSMTDLGNLGYPDARASGINDFGHIVGTSITSDLEIVGFQYSHGVMSSIGYLPDHIGSNAVAINDVGQIVGFSTFEAPHAPSDTAFLWDKGEMTDLFIGRAMDINDSGQVVGWWSFIRTGGLDRRAVLWDNGEVYEVSPYSSYATAINKSGVIIGHQLGPTLDQRGPFVYEDGSLIDLNSHLAPGSEEWIIEWANDINDQGWIVGEGEIIGEWQTRPVLLRPVVPEFGDFDNSGQLDIADIDSLSEAIRFSSENLIFDVSGNGIVDGQDRRVWVEDEFGTFFGDANLNKDVDFADFLSLSLFFNKSGGWAEGDFDGSGVIGFADFLLLSSNFGKSANVAAIPEPSGIGLALIATVAMLSVYRHRS